MAHATRRVSRLMPAMLAAVLLPIFLSEDANAQQFFDVKSVIQDVQKRFRLTSSDLQHIGPLIQKDNSDLLVVYERFGGTEPEYSDVLWRRIIDQRRAFEEPATLRLTKRQMSAVRVARRSLETRILTRIVEDYVDFLVVYLELEALEMEAIEHLLHKERRTKHQLILRHLQDPKELERELDDVSERTEYWLSKILSAEQMRLYRELSEQDPTFVA